MCLVFTALHLSVVLEAAGVRFLRYWDFAEEMIEAGCRYLDGVPGLNPRGWTLGRLLRCFLFLQLSVAFEAADMRHGMRKNAVEAGLGWIPLSGRRFEAGSSRLDLRGWTSPLPYICLLSVRSSMVLKIRWRARRRRYGPRKNVVGAGLASQAGLSSDLCFWTGPWPSVLDLLLHISILESHAC